MKPELYRRRRSLPARSLQHLPSPGVAVVTPLPISICFLLIPDVTPQPSICTPRNLRSVPPPPRSVPPWLLCVSPSPPGAGSALRGAQDREVQGRGGIYGGLVPSIPLLSHLQPSALREILRTVLTLLFNSDLNIHSPHQGFNLLPAGSDKPPPPRHPPAISPTQSCLCFSCSAG